MKFGKSFTKQMVPEWTEAYMDYNGLKKQLRDIRLFKQSKQPNNIRSFDHENKLQLHTPFRALHLQQPNDHPHHHWDIEDQVISVDTMEQNNSRKLYNTKFLMSSEEGGDKEAIFFQKLDGELNKVNKFYKYKVDQVLDEAAKLNKQMEAFIALRIKLKNPDFDSSEAIKRLSSDITAYRTHNSDDVDFNSRQEEQVHARPNVGNNFGDEIISHDKERDPFKVLDRVKINNTLLNPISSLKGILTDSRDKELKFKKDELKDVEKRLKHVFEEFYQKLRHLKLYSFANLSAFAKIMKKYEKITTRNVSRLYMKIVDDSFLGSSDEVSGLMERVEATYVNHFSKSNRREGMKLPKPRQKVEKHSVTFFSGIFLGCSMALVVSVVQQLRIILEKEENKLYMVIIFRLYSLFACIVLHMLLYAANTYLWKRYRINYPFIFGFKRGTELGYREVFLWSSGLTVLALATLWTHLYLKLYPTNTTNYDGYIELLPLGLVVVLFFILFCPFNILYRSSRFFLLNTMFRCVCAPFYQVTLPDFFLADQLGSQIEAIRSIEFYICYYSLGDIFKRSNQCRIHNAYNVFYYILAVLPYWLRFLQCMRRVVEEKDDIQGYNAVRYLLSVVAVIMRTTFKLNKGYIWKVLAVIFSVLATIFNTYWDIVRDWGLLQRHSRNFLLRDKLVVKNKAVYFLAMVFDILLRFSWLQLMLDFDVHTLNGRALSSTFSFLEITRRGMWNFFRLENEHLNNVGKYRAFKSVPLPFSYEDDDDDDEKKD